MTWMAERLTHRAPAGNQPQRVLASRWMA
jgi:hypothetical protein